MDVTLFLLILTGALVLALVVWLVTELTWWGWVLVHRKRR